MQLHDGHAIQDVAAFMLIVKQAIARYPLIQGTCNDTSFAGVHHEHDIVAGSGRPDLGSYLS